MSHPVDSAATSRLSRRWCGLRWFGRRVPSALAPVVTTLPPGLSAALSMQAGLRRRHAGPASSEIRAGCAGCFTIQTVPGGRLPLRRSSPAWASSPHERYDTNSAVLPRMPDGCIALMMRKARPREADVGRRACCFRGASGCWLATHAITPPGPARRSQSCARTPRAKGEGRRR